LEWFLEADSGAGIASIEDALVNSLLQGDLPQTIVPGVFEPQPQARMFREEMDENTGVEEFSISLTDGYLADGSNLIAFGVSIEDLDWQDGLPRELLGQNADGQVELLVEFLRGESTSPVNYNEIVDSVSLMAQVDFDGSRLEIFPISYEFDEALFFDFSTFASNGLREFRIEGITFGIQSVPEPSTAVMMALFAFGFVCRRRRGSC
jgi:hypothetical protein